MDKHTVGHYTTGISTCPGSKTFPSTSYFFMLGVYTLSTYFTIQKQYYWWDANSETIHGQLLRLFSIQECWIVEEKWRFVKSIRHLKRLNKKVGWRCAPNKWMIVLRAIFSKSLNLQNIDKSVSHIRIRIQFPFESSFWISGSGCKPTILPDIQPANRIVIIFAVGLRWARIRTRWDWIRTEAYFGRIRTLSDCNALRIGGSGLDRTEKIFLV